MNKKYLLTALLFLAIATTKAQQNNTHDGTGAGGPASNTISVSNADPGVFPYIKKNIT